MSHLPKQLILVSAFAAPISFQTHAEEPKNTSVVDEEIVVYGQLPANKSAISKQRDADNNISIIDTKAMGAFPDQNVSEALQRLPGVSIERDQGEGRFVAVRGLNPDYNSVSINGVNVPSPDSGRRAVALDVIPNDLVGSIQVTKTITADKDADSLGGAIEVNSISAFDFNDTYYRVYAENSYNQLESQSSPKLGFTFANTFNDSFGIAFSASYYDRDFGSDNVETGGGWIVNDSGTAITGPLEELEQRDYTINRERFGFGLNLDYKLNDSTELYFKTLYASFTDDEIRLANAIEWDEGTPPNTAKKAEVARELKDRKETQEITSISFGGQSLVNTWTFDYRIGYSDTSEEEGMHIDGAKFEATIPDLAFTGTKKPRIIQNAAYIDNDNYELKEVELADANVQDKQVIAKFDAANEFTLNSYESGLKFGIKLSQHEKESDEDVIKHKKFNSLSADQKLLSHYVKGNADYNIGQFGSRIDSDKLLSTIKNTPSKKDLEGSAVNDYTIDESINAAYAMLTMEVNDWTIIPGLRYESTEVDSEGNRYDDANEELISTKYSESYTHVLPSVLSRWDINDQMIFRAAWTNTIARPTFEQISPGVVDKSIDDQKLEAGNPNLEALESSNLDFSYEYYSDDSSVFSVGVFYKNIDNFIYATKLKGDAIGLDPSSDLETWANGESSTLYGLELNYTKAFYNGFIVSANMTKTSSDATIKKDDFKRDVQLPGQSDLVGNLSLGYEDDRYSVRLSANYKSDVLIKIKDIEKEAQDVYEDKNLQFDLVSKVELSRGFGLYFNAINITDTPYYAYQNKSTYNYQYEEYGRTFVFGIEYKNL